MESDLLKGLLAIAGALNNVSNSIDKLADEARNMRFDDTADAIDRLADTFQQFGQGFIDAYTDKSESTG